MNEELKRDMILVLSEAIEMLEKSVQPTRAPESRKEMIIEAYHLLFSIREDVADITGTK